MTVCAYTCRPFLETVSFLQHLLRITLVVWWLLFDRPISRHPAHDYRVTGSVRAVGRVGSCVILRPPCPCLALRASLRAAGISAAHSDD